MVSIAALLLFLIIPVALSLAAIGRTDGERSPVRVAAKARSNTRLRY
jgi:hypothetical protein